MENFRLNNCIEILKYALNHNISVQAASLKLSKGKNYFSNFLNDIEKRKNSGYLSNSEYNQFYDLYNKYLNLSRTKRNIITKNSKATDVEYDANTDDNYDERSIGESIRDDNGKIKEYHYKILVRDSSPLEGSFTREEMDKVYRLYSNVEGGGFTVKAVSRDFPLLTFRDFKRILRAFNITKQSIPVAPHILEENTPEYVTEYILRNTENFVLKKVESEKEKFIAKNLLEAQKKLIQIQNNDEWVAEIVQKYIAKSTPTQFKTIEPNKKQFQIYGKPCICIFGDIHYGKKFDKPAFGRGYNKDIAHERVMSIASAVIADYNTRHPSEIILINVGDLVECVLEDGMHPGHTYEMDLFKEEQIFFAVDSLKEMLNKIRGSVSLDCIIRFHAIHGNHDRIGLDRNDDKNRTAGKIISTILKRELECNNLTFNIPKNNLIKIVSQKLSIFVQHGDSSLSKKKPSELVNLFGEPGCYSILVQGHWHSLKAEEGTNYIALTSPSVASTDKYIMEELGNNNLPGFIIGHEPNNCYGFNYSKITLY